MKCLVTLLSICLLTYSSLSRAETWQGWYTGLMIGGSKASNQRFTAINPLTRTSVSGELDYSIFGNLALHAGYEICGFDIEAELLYNYSPYNHLKLNGVVFNNRNTQDALGFYIPYIKGSTNAFAGFINGLYNFNLESNFIPYLGIGVGDAYLNNHLSAYIDQTKIYQQSFSDNTLVWQGIIGANYFFSNQFGLGLDFRYLSSAAISRSNSNDIQISSLNLKLNYFFDDSGNW